MESPAALNFSVPSGNFGNLTAGLIASRMGLPVKQFIAAVNANDVFPQYLKTGKYTPKPVWHTHSNAMDVGNPSNFSRIVELFDHDYQQMKAKIQSRSISDEQTEQGILECYTKYQYKMDPHGAVGYMAQKLHTAEEEWIVLETAHPAKFPEVVNKTLNLNIEVPQQLQDCLSKKKTSTLVQNDYKMFKSLVVELLAG
jgi:threonine synthase